MSSNAKSAFPAHSLIPSLPFFSFKVSHIYLPMLSRHLKISKPIWHYLHHRRPLKFASVEWVWQAITPMQDIGNLTRICSDKSGRSGGASPGGGGGGSEGRGAAESRPAALHKKTWGLMWRWEIGECWEGPKRNAPVTDTCKHTADMSKHTVGREVNKVSYSTELVFYITTLLSSPSPLQRNLYS